MNSTDSVSTIQTYSSELERNTELINRELDHSRDLLDKGLDKSREILDKSLDKSREILDKNIDRSKVIIDWMRKTLMLKRYYLQFVFRLVIFLTVFFFYITRRNGLVSLMARPFFMGISPLHVLWAYFMIIMITHLLPREKTSSMAILKAYESPYTPVADYSELSLLQFVKKMNIRAWMVMLVWLIFNAVFAALYLFGVIAEVDMLMLTTFFFLSDYICILFFCPFQSFIMKNKCCVNCRIYDWGHFMMFTPLLFIKNFFSWSLFFTSCIVLIRWEIKYARHPERFWYGSNENLKCENCKEQLCHYKRVIQMRKEK